MAWHRSSRLSVPQPRQSMIRPDQHSTHGCGFGRGDQMATIDELTDVQAAAFGHAFLRWVVDEDPASVAHFFPDLDPHQVKDAEASDLGRAVLEDLLAERFLKQDAV